MKKPVAEELNSQTGKGRGPSDKKDVLRLRRGSIPGYVARALTLKKAAEGLRLAALIDYVRVLALARLQPQPDLSSILRNRRRGTNFESGPLPGFHKNAPFTRSHHGLDHALVCSPRLR